MDFLKLLKTRRACHHFLPNKKIPKKDLETIIDQARLTPSGYNAQPWAFVVCREKENLKKIQEIAFAQPHLKNAGAIIVVLADHDIGRNVDTLLQDWLKYGYCTPEEIPAYRNSIAKKRSPEKLKLMAIRNAMLAAMTVIYAAENFGYATCPIMGFSQLKMEEHLQIPKDHSIALTIAIGHRDQNKEKPQLPRKKISDMLHWEQFKHQAK